MGTEWARIAAIEAKRSRQALSLSQMIGPDQRLNMGLGRKRKERK